MQVGTAAEVTKKELADRSGVGRPTIDRILAAEGEGAGAATLKKLADALSVELPVIERRLSWNPKAGEPGVPELAAEIRALADQILRIAPTEGGGVGLGRRAAVQKLAAQIGRHREEQQDDDEAEPPQESERPA